MTKSKRLLQTAGAACLTAGFISTWDTPNAQASAYTFNGEITPAQNLSAVYFIFASGGCTPAYSRKIADFIPGNTTTPFSVTLNSVYPIDGSDYIGDHFAIIGLYDTANAGISLAFDPSVAADMLAQSPTPDFGGHWTGGYGVGGDEASIAANLLSGLGNGVSLDDSSAGGLIDPNAGHYWWNGEAPTGDYYAPISTDPSAPSAFTLLNFSSATPGGSGFAYEVVPEPASSALLLGGGLLLVLGQRRKRRPA